ncbi:hypothetical protein KY348_04235 [Candidatus Woesearchaeota archaeon]|nr:hypothetical protein [Candidatus Woesearchaeota archaeon]
MRKVVTHDGSITFHSNEYDETYHSVSGAVEEAYKKFAEPALEFVKGKEEVSILDVGFGLGYNSAAVMDKILEESLWCKIYIIGLEKDKKILDKIKELKPMIKTYHIIQDLVERGKVNDGYEYDREGVKIKLLVADALQAVKTLGTKFDIILHDPFSPKKNPELWTESFFKELRKHIKDNGMLTTYSCAGEIRRNLKKAGFEVSDGPRVGRRAPSTIARPK